MMMLKQNDWLYESVLFAKRNTMKTAAQLIRELNQAIENLKDQNNKQTCEKALQEFYQAIVKANELRKSSLDVQLALEKLSPLNNIIPCEATETRRLLNFHQSQLNHVEMYYYYSCNVGLIVLETLFLAGLVAATAAAAIFYPPALMMLPLIISSALVSLLCIIGFVFNNDRFKEMRGCIEDQAAINVSTFGQVGMFKPVLSAPLNNNEDLPSSNINTSNVL